MIFQLIKILYFSILFHHLYVEADTDLQWRKAALEQHNKYRKLHQALPLTMNDELCQVSQKWADHLSETGGFEHSKGSGFGENLYMSKMWSSGGVSPKKPSPTIAVEKWYDEIKDYDFEAGESKTGKVVGHFTQVVWKGSKQVCVSFAQKINDNSIRSVVVANYDPPGNYIGEYTKNVIRASEQEQSGNKQEELIGDENEPEKEKPLNETGKNEKSNNGGIRLTSTWAFYIGIVLFHCYHLLH